MALVMPLQMGIWDHFDHFPGGNPGPRFSSMRGPPMLGALLGLEGWAAPLPPPCTRGYSASSASTLALPHVSPCSHHKARGRTGMQCFTQGFLWLLVMSQCRRQCPGCEAETSAW